MSTRKYQIRLKFVSIINYVFKINFSAIPNKTRDYIGNIFYFWNEYSIIKM